jgi:uncharacterized protein YkwD
LLVKLAPGVNSEQIHRSLGGVVTGAIPALGIEIISLPGIARAADAHSFTLDAVRAYDQAVGVLWAEPDYIAYAIGTPNDPQYSQQWALPKISAPQAWDKTTGGGILAIVDTGVSQHPDLVGKVLQGYDFANGDSSPDDDHGHGTLVSGVAAASGDNGAGIAGVCWGCKILPVKVLGSNGSGSYSAIAQGIVYAVDHGARVINMSLGGPSAAQTMEDAINYAWNKNVLPVVAAGNAGSSAPNYPAACANALAVGATDSNDQLASFSSYGAHVRIAAPGVGILGTARGGGYSSASGTSLACPIVTGEAGLVLGMNPGLSVAQLRSILEGAVDPADARLSGGRINAYKAVSGLSPVPLPTPGGATPVPTIAATRTPTPAATAQPTPVGIEAQVVALVNQNRVAAGLSPVVMESHLLAAARRHSLDMAGHSLCSHTGSDGSSPWDRISQAGYPYSGIGECVGCGYNTAAAVVDGWMGSAGHKAIIMDAAARDIGVGYAACTSGSCTYPYSWTLDTGAGSGPGPAPLPTATLTPLPTATPPPTGTPTTPPQVTATPGAGYCLRCTDAAGPDACVVITCP